MSKVLSGFKDFISRGSAVDLAVGVVVGAAFGAVITALTDSIINPLIAAIFGKPSFDDFLAFTIHLYGDPTLVQPGVFLGAIINFLIVAASLYFVVVLPLNTLAERKKTDEPEAAVPADEQLLIEIRDLLKEANSK